MIVARAWYSSSPSSPCSLEVPPQRATPEESNPPSAASTRAIAGSTHEAEGGPRECARAAVPQCARVRVARVGLHLLSQHLLSCIIRCRYDIDMMLGRHTHGSEQGCVESASHRVFTGIRIGKIRRWYRWWEWRSRRRRRLRFALRWRAGALARVFCRGESNTTNIRTHERAGLRTDRVRRSDPAPS